MKKTKIKRLLLIMICTLVILLVFHPIAAFFYNKGCGYDVTFFETLFSKETWKIFPVMSIGYIFTFLFCSFGVLYLRGSGTGEAKAERERNIAASKYANASAIYRSSLKTGNPSRIRSAANERDAALAKLISKSK